MKTKLTLFSIVLLFNINLSLADTIQFNTGKIELKYKHSNADSIIMNINTSIKEGKNIILLKYENEDQKPTFADKLLDNFNVLLGVIIGSFVTFLLSLIQDERGRSKLQKKYNRLLDKYILYLSVQEQSIKKDENYKLLFPISGEFAEVTIEPEKNAKLFETTEAIDLFEKNHNAAQFKMSIKRIWNLS